ncbi:MAG: caspase family protein [Spirochaetota bacterium]
MRLRTFKHAALLFLTLAVLGCFLGCKLGPGDIPGGVAVIYGVAVYPDLDDSDLTYTDDDGRAMRDLFVAKYGSSNVIFRESAGNPGDDATRARLEQDLQDAANLVGPGDNFVFYFSGHGGQTDSLPESREGPGSDSLDELIFFQDAAFDSGTDTWTAGALSEEELLALLQPIPTSRKFVIIDACNSGGFVGTSADVDGTSQDYDSYSVTDGLARSIELYIRYPEIGSSDLPYNEAIVLSAAGEREFSYESGTIGHGVFTYFFLDTPTRGDLNGDGAVTIDEAFRYTSDRIDEQWNTYLPSDQFHPHVSGGPVNYVLFSAE